MTIKKKSLISDSPAAKTPKKQAPKANSLASATKMATAMVAAKSMLTTLKPY